MNGLYLIAPGESGRPRLEVLLATLRVSRHYLLAASRGLTAAELDARPERAANTIGMLLAHVAAAEAMFTNLTTGAARFDAGQEHLAAAFRFEGNPLAGSDIGAYHDLLERTRATTRARLAERDDAWLDTAATFAGHPCNVHYYWTHFVLDEARHTGQVTLIRKYLLGSHDPDFDPYAPPG